MLAKAMPDFKKRNRNISPLADTLFKLFKKTDKIGSPLIGLPLPRHQEVLSSLMRGEKTGFYRECRLFSLFYFFSISRNFSPSKQNRLACLRLYYRNAVLIISTIAISEQ